MVAHNKNLLDGVDRVLVTGGAGFIGSHLCDELVTRGYSLVVIDDLRSGQPKNLPCSLENISFEQLTIGDPSNRTAIQSAIKKCGFVFHMASSVGVNYVHQNPRSTRQNITKSGSLVIELCREYGVPFLLASSSEVYGADPICPTHEDSPLTESSAARFAYATAKIALEEMAVEYHKEGVIDVRIVRFFNVAGPRQRSDAGVISSFADALARGIAPKVHGDGRQIRTFLHVFDAINALLQIAGCEALAGRPVNIGSEVPVQIAELAQLMSKDAQGKDSVQISYSEVFGDDFEPVVNRQPSTKLLRDLTGWQPTRTLEDIIRDCMNYARLETL